MTSIGTRKTGKISFHYRNSWVPTRYLYQMIHIPISNPDPNIFFRELDSDPEKKKINRILSLLKFDAFRQLLITMVLLLYGNSETGAHIRINFCHLICLRHLNRTSANHKSDFFLRKDLFSFMCAQHVLSYHLIGKYHAHNGLQKMSVNSD